MAVAQKTMELYFFPSEKWENIKRAVKNRIWGIPKPDTEKMRRQFTAKALKMPIGAHGIFYIRGGFFTTPFIVMSKPDPERLIANLWEGDFILPFRIQPLTAHGPNVPIQEVLHTLPSFRESDERWDMRIRIKPTEYFLPSELLARDWESLVEKLAPVGEMQPAV